MNRIVARGYIEARPISVFRAVPQVPCDVFGVRTDRTNRGLELFDADARFVRPALVLGIGIDTLIVMCAAIL
jgi:hypothetical protein